MRRFTSYGPVDTDDHYYAPRKELIGRAYNQLLGENSEKSGHYITVWAPRQCGKTWVMQEVVENIKKTDQYEVAILTMERAREVKKEKDILDIFTGELAEVFQEKFPAIKSFDQIPSLFKTSHFPKPVILIIDEFDALEEEFINSFAGIFRYIFINRTNEKNKKSREKTYLLHGLALVGVRSVLGIENETGSPFNVQRSLHIPNLTFEEVDGMFKWYEKESGQEVEDAVIHELYEELAGQPGLTCWFGELLTETYNQHKPAPITMKHFKYSYKIASNVLPNNNILNIISKVKKAPYRAETLELFKTGKKIEFRFDNEQLNYLYMNGVIDIDMGENEKGELETYCKFSNAFVQTRLFNYFSNEIFKDLGLLIHPLDEMNDAVNEESLNIPNIVKRYKAYLKKNREMIFKKAPRRKTDLKIFEAIYHFNLYRYLYDLLKKRGVDVIPEFPTGNGKIDLILKYRQRVYALELKSFRDMYDYRKGIEQAEEYGRQMGLKEIVFIVFVELSEEEVKELDQVIEKPGIDVIVIPVGILG